MLTERINTRIGRILRDYRKKQGISLVNVAGRLGDNYTSALSKLEKGGTRVRVDDLIRICRYGYGLPWGELLAQLGVPDQENEGGNN